jgi:hypothetical protein
MEEYVPYRKAFSRKIIFDHISVLANNQKVDADQN